MPVQRSQTRCCTGRACPTKRELTATQCLRQLVVHGVTRLSGQACLGRTCVRRKHSSDLRAAASKICRRKGRGNRQQARPCCMRLLSSAQLFRCVLLVCCAQVPRPVPQRCRQGRAGGKLPLLVQPDGGQTGAALRHGAAGMRALAPALQSLCRFFLHACLNACFLHVARWRICVFL